MYLFIQPFFAGLYCFAYGSYAYLKSGTLYPTGQTGHFIYNRFMHHKLSSAIGLHAIYFSFYVSLAGIAVLQKMLFKEDLKNKVIYWSTCLFVFFALLLFCLKSSLFAFIFPVACLLLVFIKLKEQFLRPKYVLMFLLLCIVTTVLSYEGIQSKLDNFETSYSFEDKHMRPLAMRLALWESSLGVISQHPLVGVGTGDGQDMLMEEYKRIHFSIGEENRFNAHNMYLQYWLSNGFFAVQLFIIFLIMAVIKAIKHRNFMFFALMLFFAFFSITESTMLKQKGIVFFMFFAFLFITDPTCWSLPTRNPNENNPST